jgi:hypothetical protein
LLRGLSAAREAVVQAKSEWLEAVPPVAGETRDSGGGASLYVNHAALAWF